MGGVREAHLLPRFPGQHGDLFRLAAASAQELVFHVGLPRGEGQHRRLARPGQQLELGHHPRRGPVVRIGVGHVVRVEQLGGGVLGGRVAGGQQRQVLLLQGQPVHQRRLDRLGLLEVPAAQVVGHGLQKRRAQPRRVAAAALAGGEHVGFVRLVEAHPHRRGQFRRVGHGPDVPGAAGGLVADGAGLARHGHAAGLERPGAAGPRGGLEHVREHIGGGRLHGPGLGGVGPVDRVARGVAYLPYEVGRHPQPAVGQGAVGPAQHLGRHAVGQRAEGQRQVHVPVRQRYAEPLGVLPQRVGADQVGQVHRGDVQRPGQRLPQGHRAVGGPARVARRVPAVEGAGRVLDGGGRHEAVGVDGGGVGGHGLEGAAGLPPDLGGVVEAQRHVVAPAAHHRPHLAGHAVQRDQAGLHRRAVRCGGGKALLRREQVLRRGLHGQVEPGQYGVAAGQNLVVGQVEDLRGLGQHRVHVPGVEPAILGVLRQLQALGPGGDRLVLGDEARLRHRRKYPVPALQGLLRVQMRRVGGGGLDDARQQRALGHGQLGGGLVEVHVRRRLDAVGPVAEVDGIEVRLQYLPLVHHLFKL